MTFVNCTIRLLHYVNAVLELLASGFFFVVLFINPSLAVWPDHFLNAGVGGMAVPLEKVSPRTFMPRHDCPPGHWCLGMNVPSRHYCPPMPDIFS